MKKVRVLIPGNMLVDSVYCLIEDLIDQRLPTRVEKNVDGQDILIVTVPGDITDDKLVELGMFIQKRFPNQVTS